MGEKEITGKLRTHLEKHLRMTEECQVVYFLVEIRKHCERSGYRDDLLKFYCDWALHARKNQVSADMRKYLGRLYAEAEKRLAVNGKDEALVEFCRMSDLRESIRCWLVHAGIPDKLVSNENSWQAFRKLLTEVLAHQEIAPEKLPHVPLIFFRKDSGICEVRFKKSVAGRNVLKVRG